MVLTEYSPDDKKASQQLADNNFLSEWIYISIKICYRKHKQFP